MNPMWLVRMAKWVRNPPSRRQVILVTVVVGLCIAIGLFEYVFGWPEALTMERRSHMPRIQLNTP